MESDVIFVDTIQKGYTDKQFVCSSTTFELDDIAEVIDNACVSQTGQNRDREKNSNVNFVPDTRNERDNMDSDLVVGKIPARLTDKKCNRKHRFRKCCW